MIDLHAHVFNAAYLPLEGIFRARRLPGYVAWPLARLLEALVEDEELRANEEVHRALADASARVARGAVAMKAAFDAADDPITALAATARTEVLEAHAADIDEALRRLDADIAAKARTPLDVDEDDVAADAAVSRLAGLPAAELRGRLLRLLRRAAQMMEGGVALVEWIVLLLRRETVIAQQLCDTFPEVTLFVHHTMDLGPHYAPSQTSYPFKYRQLQRVRALTERFGGRLLPFVAYSPFREDGVELVRQWVGRGFAGVKFYPPSGYRPLGNIAEDLRNDDQDPAVVDARNLELFRFCAANDVPIFAHCQPGEFQRYRGAGCLSHPDGWRPVLETPGLERLRLCLGHAGGEGWAADPGAEDDDAGNHCERVTGFVARAVDLCVEYDNVYLEFGCMETILEREAAAANLAARLRHHVARHGERLGKFIVYGSDWHMLARTPGVGEYAAVLRRLFASDEILRPFADDFFVRNALRFLGLPRFLERNAGRLSDPVAAHLARVIAEAPADDHR